MNRICNWLFRGRPMKKVTYCFFDGVSGKPIYIWRDSYFNKYWLAETKWSLFRVQAKHGPEIWTVVHREAAK